MLSGTGEWFFASPLISSPLIASPLIASPLIASPLIALLLFAVALGVASLPMHVLPSFRDSMATGRQCSRCLTYVGASPSAQAQAFHVPDLAPACF